MNGAADEGPFYEGQNAFARGEERTACPYVVPARVRLDWLSGWREAKRYADVQMIIEIACRCPDEARDLPDAVDRVIRGNCHRTRGASFMG